VSGRRVLVVSYGFPPSSLVAGVRWSLMDTYLRRLGYTVSVVTSDAFGSLPDDGERVVRPANLESSAALRRLLRRPANAGAGGLQSATPSAPSLLTRLVVPDPWALSWVPFAWHAARRLVRAGGVDCVITTSPGESTHLVGLALRRLGPAWLADFRDGWSFETARPTFPSALQRRLDAGLERRVVRRADVTVAATQGIAADFRRRLGVEAIHVPNGVDPEAHAPSDEPEAGPSANGNAGRVRLVYTGRLGVGTARRHAEGFFSALEQLSEREPALAARLELVIAGPESSRDAELLAGLSGATLVRHLGHLPRAESLRLQRSADVLVLLGSDGSEAPAKLFEYLGARRPVLYAGGPSAAAEILAQTRSGVTVAHDDVEAIGRALRTIANGAFATDFSPGGLEPYSYPGVAEAMAAAIEQAIAHRRGGARGGA
jgi:glycosyltransferase involved in cell wall biosynthesis